MNDALNRQAAAYVAGMEMRSALEATRDLAVIQRRLGVLSKRFADGYVEGLEFAIALIGDGCNHPDRYVPSCPGCVAWAQAEGIRDDSPIPPARTRVRK